MAEPHFIYSPQVQAFGLKNANSYLTLTFADIDGDGDLDAFSGNISNYDTHGSTVFFRNTGTAKMPNFIQEDSNFGIGDVNRDANPTFVDIDGDGDFDAFIGAFNGTTVFFRNTGTAQAPQFSQQASNFGISDVGNAAAPSFADIDGDGDLDAFLGTLDGNTVFFRNTGTAQAARFIQEDSNFGIDSIGYGADPTFADIDRDGDLDAFVSNPYFDYTSYFPNIGTAQSPNFSPFWSIVFFGIGFISPVADLNFADIDGDGDLDAFGLNKNGFFTDSNGVTYDNNVIDFYRNNNIPTFSTFTNVLTSGLADTTISINLAQLSTQGNEKDSDGSVTGFVVETVASGSLKIGKDVYTATPWAAGSNAVIDANHQAFWTPASNVIGKITAFTVVAQDNDGVKSSVPVAAKIAVTQPTTLVLVDPSPITYTDTAFKDSFHKIASTLQAVNINHSPLVYGISGGIDKGNGTVSMKSAYGTLTVSKATGNFSFVAKGQVIEALGVAATSGFQVTVTDGAHTVSKIFNVNIVQQGHTETLGDDNLDGTIYNDTIDGLDGNDLINGGHGNDRLLGGLGNDVLIGGGGFDVIDGGTGVDWASYLTANVGVTVNLSLSTTQNTLGADGDKLINIENLTGSKLADTLIGNATSNVMNGGLGNDQLTGGTGQDTFLFDSVINATNNRDTIVDYNVVDDTLRLENTVFNQLTTTGVLPTGNFISGPGAKALDSNDNLIYDTTDGTLYYDADGSGAGQQVAFVTLTGLPAITAADFFVL